MRNIPQLIPPEQAAEVLGVSVTTMATWRSTGRVALPFVKIGSRVMYVEDDLRRFIESNTHNVAG